jgi:hypothetical protein
MCARLKCKVASGLKVYLTCKVLNSDASHVILLLFLPRHMHRSLAFWLSRLPEILLCGNFFTRTVVDCDEDALY